MTEDKVIRLPDAVRKALEHNINTYLQQCFTPSADPVVLIAPGVVDIIEKTLTQVAADAISSAVEAKVQNFLGRFFH